MFEYSSEHRVPWSVKCVLESRFSLWYNEKMCPFPLKFVFPKMKPPKDNNSLIWRYHAEVVNGSCWKDQTRTIFTGYFNLSKDKPTELDLEGAFGNGQVKWLRFTVFNCQNPMKRAWFSPIKGEHFLREG